MYKSLEKAFIDSLEDDFAISLNTEYVEARIVFGIKIIRDRNSKDVEIYNTTKGGDYYEEISSKEYKIFIEKGWRYGVYVLSLSNYRRKLDAIDKTIQSYIIQGSTKNALIQAQERRTKIMNRYSKISNKLNLLN